VGQTTPFPSHPGDIIIEPESVRAFSKSAFIVFIGGSFSFLPFLHLRLSAAYYATKFPAASSGLRFPISFLCFGKLSTGLRGKPTSSSAPLFAVYDLPTAALIRADALDKPHFLKLCNILIDGRGADADLF
jgi:hypothetical protein